MTKLEYKYDSQNQLVRVDDYDQNYTFTYSYDTNGNMEYSYKYVLGSTSTGDLRGLDTNSYDSTWSDKLTYSTKVGAITYDAIGNPLKYGNNTLSWTGRQLETVTGGNNSYSYEYDYNGLRRSKTVNGEKTKYQWSGDGRLLSQTDAYGNVMYFHYDEAGRQTIRIDWTNHGYFSHVNLHVHYTTYNSQYRDGITIRWD